MTPVRVDNLGTAGVIRDVPNHTLPPEAWSAVSNMRFRDGVANRTLGHVPVFGTPLTGVRWLLPAPSPGVYYWLGANLTDVYAWNSATWTEITKSGATYGATEDLLWNGGLLGGVPVLNNGVDVPQVWSPKDTGQLLVDLPNWPAAERCQIMRPFGNFLFAMDVTVSGTRYEHRVHWSHPADPGDVPISWDETDPTRLAGIKELTDTQAGGILDAWTLGNFLMIYKAGSMWRVSLVQDEFVFDFESVFETVGVLTTDCVREVPRRRMHFLATGDDLVVHDGQSMQSVVDRKMRKYIFQQLSTAKYKRSFVVPNPRRNEMWFCCVTDGGEFPNRAFIWNFSDGTVTERDLPVAAGMALGIVVEASGETWDADSTTWDSDTSVWDDADYSQQAFDLLAAVPGTSKVHHFDRGETFDGAAVNAFLERTGLAIIGRDRQGQPKVDFTRRKLCTRVWPKAKGGPFNIRLGSQEVEDGPITWSPAMPFTPGVDRYVDPDTPVSGVFLAVRFESMSADAQWSLSGYDLDISVLGNF